MKYDPDEIRILVLENFSQPFLCLGIHKYIF